MADFQEGEQRFIDGDTIIKQSPMAWMLPAFPWVVILSVAAFTDFLTMGILPVGLAMLVVLPRYFNWRKMSITLTSTQIRITQPRFGNHPDIIRNFSDINGYTVSSGFLGGPLGYRRIDLHLEEEGVDKMLPLTYIPVQSPLIDHLDSHGITLKVENTA